MAEMMDIRKDIEHLIYERFGINHITLQIDYDCCFGNADLINTKNLSDNE